MSHLVAWAASWFDTPTTAIPLYSTLAIAVAAAGSSALLQRPLADIPHNASAAYTILGDIPQIYKSTQRRQLLADQPKMLGSPIVQLLTAPLRRPWILISDFRETQDMLLHRTRDFDRSHYTSQQFGGVAPNHHITMQSIDPRFKGNKELIRDLMTPAFLHNVSAPQIYEKITMLVDLWNAKAGIANGRPFAAAHDIWGAALDIIMTAAFGLDESQAYTLKQIAQVRGDSALAGSPDADRANPETEPCDFEACPLEPELQAFVTISESLNVALRSQFPVVSHWIYRQSGKWRQAVRRKNQLIKREIEKSLKVIAREQEAESEHDTDGGRRSNLRCAMDQLLLREISAATKAGRSPDIFSPVIQDELLGYLVAGHDTTSTTLAWWVKYMATSQESQHKLRQAIFASHSGARAEGRPPTVQEIIQTRIPYLDAVMEETLRLSRTLPLLIRQAMHDTTVLGYNIPKGTTILLACNGPSIRSPSIPVDERRRTENCRATKDRYGEWDPASIGDFSPERWLKTTDDGGQSFDPMAGPNLAFGAGPRGCFGRKMAYLELRVALTLLLWNFELGTVEGERGTWESIDRFTTMPKDCYVRLSRVS